MHPAHVSQVIRQVAKRKGLSQSELAKRSGVSRVQINRIFAGNVEAVRSDTLERLTQSLDISTDDFPGLAVVEKYRALVIERLGKKSFAGLGLPDLPEQTLSSIFVPPLGLLRDRTIPHAQTREGGVSAINGLLAAKEDARERRGAQTVDQLLAVSPRSVVVGPPGAGKTTLLQYLAVSSAKGTYIGSDFPVFIRLPDFASALDKEADLDFVGWIVARAADRECPGLAAQLDKAMRGHSSPVLFLLDGLDEVPSDGLRRKIIAATGAFVRKFGGNRFIVTSRSAGFDESPWAELDFSVVQILEYGDEQIQNAVAKWARVLSTKSAEPAKTISSDLVAAICENPRVRQIASNPLVLTILIFLCRSRGYALPRRRVDLYQKVSEVFLESWEASKRNANGHGDLQSVDLDTRELNWLIAELALAMQRAGLVTAKRWWIAEHMQSMLSQRIGYSESESKEKTDAILRFISHRTGMLEERTNDLFAFSHRTLQEYFAALGLIDEAELIESKGLSHLIRKYVYHPEWKEVLRLTAAQVSPRRAEELVRVILEDPEPIGRLLHRGPQLALDCLGDGTTVANRKVVNQIFDAIHDLGSSPWLGITMEILDTLNSFQGTRYEAEANSSSAAILKAARNNLDDEDVEQLLFAAAKDVDVSLEGWNGANDSSAVIVGELKSNGVAQPLFVPNFLLMTNTPDVWLEDAENLVESSDAGEKCKIAALIAMGTIARRQPKARSYLKRVLRSSRDVSLRVAAARALASVAVGVQKPLASLVADLESPAELREACIFALRANHKNFVDRTLVELLRSRLNDASENTHVRAAAACALSMCLDQNIVISEDILRLAENDKTPGRVAWACIAALESVATKYLMPLIALANLDDLRGRASCQVLADALVSGDIPWHDDLVSRIELVLGGLGIDGQPFGSPCGHALATLRSLLDAKERLGSLRMEKVLAQSLEGLASRIAYAFIFGSVAREQQEQESDLDLLLIGDVSLRDIASPIRQAESHLGRSISPVMYSKGRFAEMLLNRNPFALEVLRKPKKAIPVGGRQVTEMELNDELGAMATEHLADSVRVNSN